MYETPEHIEQPINALRIVGDLQPCAYLPPRRARHEYLFARRVAGRDYHRLMDLNFRRGGLMIYRPVCDGCRECRQIRVPAAEFRPNRSQRRNWRLNSDLELHIGEPRMDAERWELYRRYQSQRHADDSPESPASLEQFLYTTCVDTLEWSYTLDGVLVMVGITDAYAASLSTVYCYYEPALARRGLGTHNILRHLRYAAAERVPYVYLGFYVRECAKMNYKMRFRPCELLEESGKWTREPRALH